MTTRSGFSLLELLVAIVIATGLALAAADARFFLEGRLRSRLERAGAAATLRTAGGLLRSEFESLGSDPVSGADLGGLSATSVMYRAFRGFGAVCRIAADTVLIETGRLGRWRARNPIAGQDSLLLYRPTGPRRPEGWIPMALAGGPAPAVCPDGSGADLYQTSLDSASLGAAGLLGPTLGRWFEVASLSVYSGSAGWQLGYAGLSAGALVQPVAGPLSGPAGFRPVLLDRLGALTAVPADGAEFEIGLVALARRDVAAGPGRSVTTADSLRIVVRLENQP